MRVPNLHSLTNKDMRKRGECAFTLIARDEFKSIPQCCRHCVHFSYLTVLSLVFLWCASGYALLWQSLFILLICLQSWSMVSYPLFIQLTNDFLSRLFQQGILPTITVASERKVQQFSALFIILSTLNHFSTSQFHLNAISNTLNFSCFSRLFRQFLTDYFLRI